ncbi:UNVERIFIED_CONTAM: ERAD-associated E3 ubiquitin-protein ligase HRD1A [Sesamum latifolium]|uniref:ERAD-associated E3 ubiquitin-protein ligase HRD1A n=1 Tax=Sesamum latifolium TaxID=2727402 RepID=A0AAW2UXG9_9LAMI
MMKLQTYAGLSLLATLAVIYHAFNSRGQFYPSMVYLSTSKISLVLLLNMGLVVMCILWQLTKKIFLGSLREAEVERLNEQSWREVMEILFTITIFREDFSTTFLAMVTALLLIKALHWLAQKRVEYIETTPSVPMLSHIRIVSFMGFLLLIDSVFLYNSIKYLVETRKASVSLFFLFEYMILATTTVSTFLKYIFYVSDMLMEGQWEKKAVYTFYLELVRDLLHLTLCMCFFLVIFVNYGVPLHLIRELYETFRNFKIRVADYIRYRNITSNMNDRFRMQLLKSSMRTGTAPPSQGSTVDGAANNNVSQHQARLQAAASAASLYEKSFVYPSPNALMWSPGYTSLPKTFGHPASTSMANDGGGAASGLSQQYEFANVTFAQLPQCAPLPSQFPSLNGQFDPESASDSQLGLQTKLIKNQIEFLQNQYQLLQTQNGEKTMDLGSSDIKGKSVSSPSSSVMDSPEI